jgi:hypothetical protein
MRLTLDLLPQSMAIARLGPHDDVPAWALAGALVSVTRTTTELSIVCETALVPADVQAVRDCRCLRVIGPLSVAETGVLASLADPLARARISIFALSTYDTDYLLVPGPALEGARACLIKAGHRVQEVSA